jgi:hypothetical protein
LIVQEVTLFKRYSYSAISAKHSPLFRVHRSILDSAGPAIDEARITTFAWSHNAKSETLTSSLLRASMSILAAVFFDYADADYGVG